MIKIENEFTIKAASTEVWSVITQLDKYEDWNSFVSRCESSLVVGEPIKMKVHLLPFPIVQKETILQYQPGEILDYGIKLPFNLLSSSRTHQVHELDNGLVRYQSIFQLKGLLSPIVALLMESKLTQGFGRMAQEMEAEVLRRQQLD